MPFQERDFFKERFTAGELGGLLGAESPRTLFNFKSVAFKKSGLDGDALSDQTLIEMLLEEPRYFRRPLVVIDGRLMPGTNAKQLAAELGF